MMVVPILGHTHGRRICSEIERPDTFPSSGLQHGLHIGKTVCVYGTNEGNTLLVNNIAYCFFCISHLFCFIYGLITACKDRETGEMHRHKNQG